MLPVPVDEFERLQAMLAAEMPQVTGAEIRLELGRGLSDLNGQIVPEAMAEMLYVLVRYRLALRLDDEPARCYRGVLTAARAGWSPAGGTPAADGGAYAMTTVLLVEDDPLIRDALALALADEDIEIVPARWRS